MSSSLRRRMAVVFQDALLLDTTVFRNLTIPLRIRGVTARKQQSARRNGSNRFGIAHLADRKARQLSGGEAQRTSLARAFALEPEFLFLDEPLGALDYPTRKALLGELGSNPEGHEHDHPVCDPRFHRNPLYGVNGLPSCTKGASSSTERSARCLVQSFSRARCGPPGRLTDEQTTLRVVQEEEVIFHHGNTENTEDMRNTKDEEDQK